MRKCLITFAGRSAVTLGLLLILSAAIQAQTAPNAVAAPPSFQMALPTTGVPEITTPVVDHAALLTEDSAEAASSRGTGDRPAFRTAYPQEVSLNWTHGKWETLTNGDRIWRLRIVSPKATDICLQYDQWRLVKPCELWLYNDDRSSVLGPFTYLDNWDGTNITPFTKGEAVTLEYHVPAGLTDVGDLSVQRVLHGYKDFLRRHTGQGALDNYGDAMACEINVRCFPDYDYEGRSVAMVFAPTFGRWCSGAMLNNTTEDGAPNFLTADHCFRADVNNWLFYFSYESPNCNPTSDGSLAFVISNASVLARYSLSDFLLLRLSRNRPDASFIPVYMGWYRGDIAPSQSWGIHHPSGDVKKICHDNNPGVSDDWNGVGPNTHWGVEWDQGITEGGSSGSPLFNTGSYVVGQLHGGSSDCVAETEEYDVYGKLATSWEGDGTSSGRLRDWLDPNNSGVIAKDSFQPVAPANDSCGAGQNVPMVTYVPYTATGSTKWAANNHSGNTGNCLGANTAPDVVYQLFLNCDYQITVSTCGSDYDTRLFVEWFDCGIAGHYNQFCSDDDGGCGTASQITFAASAGTAYKIWVDGYASAYGNYVLNITGTASGSQGNAACPGYQITSVPYFTYGANWCGGDQVNPTCRPTNDGDDIHYYWISPYNQAMRAKTCYTNFDTILELRHSGACPGDWLVGCNDDATCGDNPLASQVVFDAFAGGTYYLHVDGYNGATGITSVELEVYNDDCSSPIVVPSLPANYEGDTRPASDDFATVVGPTSKEVFFKYTSPSCQTVGVAMCDDYTNFDTAVEVRTGGPCPGSTLVTFNDDYCGPAPARRSQVNFSAEANRTYYIIIGGYGTDAGPFMVYFYNIPGAPVAPLADVCPGILIPSVPFTDYGNTACMHNNYSNCVGATMPEMVYYLSRPQCEMVTVSLCGSSYDAALGIYGGICPNIAPLIVCNDDNYCGGVYSLQSTVTFLAEANSNYQILVHGHPNNPTGPYVINVTSAPCPPDRVDDAVASFDVESGNVVMNWGAAPGADRYRVYRAPNYETLFDAGNVIAIVVGTSFTCEGCLNDPAPRAFFGVIAEDVDAGPSAPAITDRPTLAKAEAVQGPVTAEEIDHFASPVAVAADVKVPPHYNLPAGAVAE